MPFIFWMGLAALRMATPLQKNFMLFMKSTPKFALVTYVHQRLFEKARFLLPLERQQSKMMPGVWFGMGSIHGSFIWRTGHDTWSIGPEAGFV